MLVSRILVIGGLLAGVAVAEEAQPPFVAAFERFARHDDIDEAVAGHLLLTELSCTACHSTSDTSLVAKRGPRLEGAGRRLQPKWLRRYVADPHGVKPGTTMPDLLAGMTDEERATRTRYLVEYLAAQREPFPTLKAGGANPLPHEFWAKGDPERGRVLYHRVGCVACHEPDATFDGGTDQPSALDKLLASLDPEEIAELGLDAAARAVPSIPHGNLPAKYTAESLTHFLLDPLRVRPSGRMPDLDLEPMDAAHVAAYLLGAKRVERVEPGDAGDDAWAGGRLFTSLGCVRCHTASPVARPRDPAGSPRPGAGLEGLILDGDEPPTAKRLTALEPDADDGCLGDGNANRPRYRLDDAQTAAVVAALEAQRFDRPEPKANELVTLTMLRANCLGCHERGGLGGVGRKRRRYFETTGHVDIGDEGRLPPSLDHVGEKLTEPWLAKVLDGRAAVRPFFHARMPRFPKALVGGLPGQLAAADEVDTRDEATVFGRTDDLAEAGRTLLDTGCVQCHPIRGESVPGTVGVDLASVTGRLRPAWFAEFLRDPGRLKPRTRMPTFFRDGVSANPDVLDGDVDRQIAAMWAYLKRADRLPLPAKVEAARSRDFELTPTDRPILLRTFVKDVGPEAIAVGYPGGANLVFDAETVRPAIAWRGRFVDAYGTWFVRFAPPAEPLGTDVTRLPGGVSFARLTGDAAAWPSESSGLRFGGYRFDSKGVPTFLYRFDAYDVEDRFEPGEEGVLRRRVVVRARTDDAPRDGLWFRPIAGAKLEHRDGTATLAGGLSASTDDVSDRGSRILGDAWLLRVTIGEPLEVEYRW